MHDQDMGNRIGAAPSDSGGMPSRRTMRPEGIFLLFFPHDGMGAQQELQMTITDIYEECPADKKIDRFDRSYSVRVFTDGFTEIHCQGEISKSKSYRGETLESALRKASADGLLDNTWRNIQMSINKGLSQYRVWIAEIEKVSKAISPLDRDTHQGPS